VYLIEYIKEVVYYELLPENQTIDAAKYCKQLNRLREVIQQKHLLANSELANRRDVTFAKKLLESEMFCRIRIVLILLHRIIIFSALFKILLKKISQIRMPSIFTISSFSRKNLRRSERRGSLICPIIGLR